MRQYGAQRRRGGDNPLGIGVIAVGSLFYLQDEAALAAPAPPEPRTAGAATASLASGWTDGIAAPGRRCVEQGASHDPPYARDATPDEAR